MIVHFLRDKDQKATGLHQLYEIKILEKEGHEWLIYFDPSQQPYIIHKCESHEWLYQDSIHTTECSHSPPEEVAIAFKLLII